MRQSREYRNIALVGFMGTGKSTVGQLVAGMLHFRFLDTDEMIERITQRRITDIFANEGEAQFRQYERQVLDQLETLNHAVISTGGGFITVSDNLEVLKKHALVVCLWCSAEGILKRVGHQTHRPLLKVGDPLPRIRALLSEREPYYRQADVLLSSEFRTAREVATHVVQHYRSLAQGPSEQ